MLDEFSETKIDSKDGPLSSGPGRPEKADMQSEGSTVDEDDDFARQLQAGMKDLLGEIENTVSSVTLVRTRSHKLREI